MKEQEKGILLEKNGADVVFTTEGDFCFVPASAAQIGSEVPVTYRFPVWWRTLAMAAAIAFFFIGFGLYRFLVPTPCAYVALDINPSLELGIDRQARVLKVNLLNEDARKMAEGVNLRGRPVTEAIDVLLDKAEELHYLAKNKSGVVMVTLVPVKKNVAVPGTKELAEVAARHIQKADLPVKVVVSSGQSDIRAEARRAGLSSGRYALKIGGNNSGRAVTVQELKSEGLAQFEATKKVSVEQLLRAGHQEGIVVMPVRTKNKQVIKKKSSDTELKALQDEQQQAPTGKPKTAVERKSGRTGAKGGERTTDSSGLKARYRNDANKAGAYLKPAADGIKPSSETQTEEINNKTVQTTESASHENVNQGVYDPIEPEKHRFTFGADIINETNNSPSEQVYGGMNNTPERAGAKH
ncbi:MAG: hypothetical protein AB1510_11720 [Bacillota bacterium]